MPRKKKPETIKLSARQEQDEVLDPISSLNKYFLCVCNMKFRFKSLLIRHVTRCTRRIQCRWCKLQFKNEGNLLNHYYYKHKEGRNFKPTKARYKCDVCDAKFKQKLQITYHIRKSHFNLYASIPHAATKEVNQVWFERVLNTNVVMEIRKTGNNCLIMKPTPPNANLQVHTGRKIDLHDQYPFKRATEETECKYCKKCINKSNLARHIYEMHVNKAKHKCNNCNLTFNRSYLYLQHVCPKPINKTKGIKRNKKNNIRIMNVVGSLSGNEKVS